MTSPLSKPVWEVWELFSSSKTSSFFCPWAFDIIFISFLHDCNNFWNFLFSKDKFKNISGKLQSSFLSSSKSSNNGFIASAFSFLYLAAFGSKSAALSSRLWPISFLLSIHLTIYDICLFPYLYLSKVKLNLYSTEDEFLLQLSINSSNSLIFPSLNNVLYWFILVLYNFSSSLSLLKTTFSSVLLLSDSSSILSDTWIIPGVGVSPSGVGVGVEGFKLFLEIVLFFWSFISLFFSSSINKSSSSYSSIISDTSSSSFWMDIKSIGDLPFFLLDFSE